jgi:small subunit ribosomal protein S16
MLAIRLRRAGSKRDPHYRVVVTDSRTGRDGRFVEILGHYHPRRQPAEIVFDLEKIQHWVDRGAQMSDTVRNLVNEAKRGGAGDATVEAAVAAEAVAEPEAEAAAEAVEPEESGETISDEDEERSESD